MSGFPAETAQACRRMATEPELREALDAVLMAEAAELRSQLRSAARAGDIRQAAWIEGQMTALEGVQALIDSAAKGSTWTT